MPAHDPDTGGLMLPRNLADRIDQRGDCWLWTSYTDRYGYGRTGGKLAHRLVYEALVGPIPQGLVIDHLCRNRSCVNPEHLEPVTNAENVLRGNPARKTHCKHGHAFDEDNTYLRPCGDGRRQCRECARHASYRYQKRKRATA